ncbi:hypothetical protein FA95DRAFT_613772 [Auriscalpium vulgare]|uniref:Uncharacterized protein n=1 Tax=Auriscalpium vulgare TaxID=40419 RepID=A0ACB8RD80_9AGAM|nr:hypothetical protein FA95DRAFT_613772 [Auriscalpium vulgare]
MRTCEHIRVFSRSFIAELILNVFFLHQLLSLHLTPLGVWCRTPRAWRHAILCAAGYIHAIVNSHTSINSWPPRARRISTDRRKHRERLRVIGNADETVYRRGSL